MVLNCWRELILWQRKCDSSYNMIEPWRHPASRHRSVYVILVLLRVMGVETGEFPEGHGTATQDYAVANKRSCHKLGRQKDEG